MEHKYKYNAFISYRHISPDKDIADKLQKKLENYKPPKALCEGKKFENWRIFRDETELPTSSNLSEDIKNALEESEFLIVICSENTGKSRWCMEEIDYFKKLHNGNNANIITLVADGNPEDVFPKSLCNEMIPVTDENGNTTYQNHIIEPLAANVAGKNLKESLKKLNTEFLRIAAPLLGCGYDNLYNREHKKKLRKIFTFGGTALAVLLLFAVYNSAMLWQISNQKAALAAANEDLQMKTEELDLSNSVLKKTNEELEKKTKEAELNMAEANKQKEIAEINLTEAQRQKTVAEKNLAEVNRQKKIAESNLSEANRQKKIAEKNLAEVNKQKKIAEDNLAEANRQKKIAEDNAAEANRQKKIAEDNAAEANRQKKIAEDNAAEANRQKKIAEDNAAEANRQKTIAEDNEAKAKEANRNLKIKNSEILVGQAEVYLKNQEVYPAIEKAIEALSKDGEMIPTDADAEKILADATDLYSNEDKMICSTVNLSGYVKFLEFSEDGTRVLAGDTNGITYVIDYDKNKVIKAFSPMDVFGQTSDYITDITIDGNTGYVLCKDQLISINMKDASLNWHYNKGYDYITRLDEIVTNPFADVVVIHGGYSLAALRKSDGTVIFETVNEYDYYNSLSDLSYMDKEGRLYRSSATNRNITVVDFIKNTKEEISVKTEKIDEILSMGENDVSIFLNILTTDNFMESDEAKLICYNKKDMSVKWETEYTADSISGYGFNTIFEFNHRLADKDDNYHDISGIALVSEYNVLLFKKETGELYFNVRVNSEDRILYCVPNTKSMSVKIGTPTMFGNQVFLYVGGGTLSDADQLLFIDENYSFDKERAFIACAENNRFALASRDSSEVSLYHYNSVQNHTVLDNMPDSFTSSTKIADNGNGLIAAIYNEKEKYSIMVYDVNNNKVVLDKEVGFSPDVISFAGEDKIFIVNTEGKAEAINTDGEKHKKADLKQLIRAAADISENTYISAYDPYVAAYENSVLYCLENGVYKVNLTGDDITLDKILYYKDLREFCISDNFVSFVSEDLKNDVEIIAYFKEGDSELQYVKENGEDVVFSRDSISSVINTNIGNTIAFINKEGYIGVYKYGSDNVSKIILPRGEVAPVKILFTPDERNVIAMCSDGSFIKYSLDTLKEIARYKSDLKIGSSSAFEFIDNTTFLAKGYENSKDIILIDSNFMKLKAQVTDFRYFMKADKKIIFEKYKDSGYVFGYYKYRTGAEIIEYAKQFIKPE